MSLRTLAWMAPLSLAAGWCFLNGVRPGFPLDDAWVHLVYARNTAAGDFLAFNPGEVQGGVTSPLWTLLCASVELIVSWTGEAFRAETGVRWLGGLLGLGTAFAGYQLNDRAGRWPAICTGLLLILDPLCNFSRFSGMELPLFGLLSLLLLNAVLHGQLGWTGWLSGMLVLTRPEGLLFGLGAMLILRRRSGTRSLIRVAIPMALCLLPWMAWCYHVSGRPFPDTVVMKADFLFDLGDIGGALLALLHDTGWGWSLPLLLLIGLTSLNGSTRGLGTWQALGAGLLVLGVAVTRPLPVSSHDPAVVPFVAQRYVLLAWPLMVSLCAAGLVSVVRTGWAGLHCRPRTALVMLSPLALVIVCGLQLLPSHALTLSQRFAAQVTQVDGQNAEAGRWIHKHLPADALVATHDAGAITYFSHRRVLDIWGNNNRKLADLIWNQDFAGAAALVGSARPDALAVFPLQYAVGQAGPEWESIRERWADQPERLAALQAYVQATGDTLATGFGLTQRGVTLRSPTVTVDSPVHESLVVFVRP